LSFCGFWGSENVQVKKSNHIGPAFCILFLYFIKNKQKTP
jgi:hypothetical protein